jgi:hypothetical protein
VAVFHRAPEFLVLLNSENLHEARHSQTLETRARHELALIDVLAELLRRGQRSGAFRSGIDPLQLYISIAALGYFFLSNSHTLSAVFGRDLFSSAERKARLKHMTALILGYLTNPGLTAGSPGAHRCPRPPRRCVESSSRSSPAA